MIPPGWDIYWESPCSGPRAYARQRRQRIDDDDEGLRTLVAKQAEFAGSRLE
jgi:hypothetical protein